jgi:hypothetical protein
MNASEYKEALVGGIIIGVTAAFIATLLVGVFLINNGIGYSDSISTLSGLATAAAFLLAFYIHRKNVLWKRQEEEDKKSLFCMEHSINAYERTCQLLDDRNNNRIKWIMAARALGDAKRLENSVSNNSHKSALDLKKMEFRNRLYEALTYENQKTGERETLPPQFFYGDPNWQTSFLIDAARDSTDPNIVSVAGTYSVMPSSKLRYLAIPSIIPILDFLEFPEGYEDPLDEYREFVVSNWKDQTGAKEGAEKYILHLNNHTVFGGMCYPTGDKAARNAEWNRVHHKDYPFDD